jgi:hypothetical protein
VTGSPNSYLTWRDLNLSTLYSLHARSNYRHLSPGSQQEI